jgi:glutamine synthetase
LEKCAEFSPDITIFLNPTDDSYSRLGNSTAPDKVDWSCEGESELMYVEERERYTRAELRSPDASANPYLVYALLIYAGLEGIKEKAGLPEDLEEAALLPGSRKEAFKIAMQSDFVKSIVPKGILKAYSA